MRTVRRRGRGAGRCRAWSGPCVDDVRWSHVAPGPGTYDRWPRSLPSPGRGEVGRVRHSVRPMRIGILGTGNVGRALAGAWNAAGHEVVLGSRKPDETAAHGGNVPVVSTEAAVAAADVVVNATPGTASLALLTSVGAPALAGKVLLDVAVGFTDAGDLSHLGESLGEELQRAFPDTRVVKTLCTLDRLVMIAPDSLEGPSTVFLSGDDPTAKDTVRGLLHDLGWSPDSVLDLGGIATARGQEHFSLLFIPVAQAVGSYRFGLRVVRLSEDVPQSYEEARTAAEAAS
ncbi:NADPH-dependent F420 reductase [Streptomyces sp. NPDC012769]|uniref:NADPH-dependent F420 reductase n=1 Tax=Streptomyces sp. NPDC012769 TaxID=3364848 RepID=UPI003688A164